MRPPRELLRSMFDAAVAAAQPALVIPRHLPPKPRGRLVVIGAGKASAAMAKAVDEHWKGELSGFVVTRYGYAVPCKRITIFESAHPVSKLVARGELDNPRAAQNGGVVPKGGRSIDLSLNGRRVKAHGVADVEGFPADLQSVGMVFHAEKHESLSDAEVDAEKPVAADAVALPAFTGKS